MDISFHNALARFRFAAANVAAYRRFLSKRGIRPAVIRDRESFERVPVMEKENYLRAYPAPKLVPKEHFPSVAYSSSGSSGSPLFWYCNDRQEEGGGKVHERIFGDIFGIRKQDPTLVVVCFSMGVWVAGAFTQLSCRWMSDRGYRITTITPGIEKEDIFHILKDLAPQFKNVIVAGYPPFLTDLFHETKARGISVPKKTFIITAGDKFQEPWRDAMLKLIGNSSPNAVINVYGCADAAVLGYETPVTIRLRRLSARHPALYRLLFGEEAVTPALYQYDPAATYFESIKGELVFTADTGIPLVRYNIHDAGDVFEYEAIAEKIRNLAIPELRRFGGGLWKLPLVTVRGRNDVAVTFYALNIYPEHLKAGLAEWRIARMATGKFFAFNESSANFKRQRLRLYVESSSKKFITKSAARAIGESVLKALLRLNIEYRKLHSSIGAGAEPAITLLPPGSRIFTKTTRGLAVEYGKKPKMII